MINAAVVGPRRAARRMISTRCRHAARRWSRTPASEPRPASARTARTNDCCRAGRPTTCTGSPIRRRPDHLRFVAQRRPLPLASTFVTLARPSRPTSDPGSRRTTCKLQRRRGRRFQADQPRLRFASAAALIAMIYLCLAGSRPSHRNSPPGSCWVRRFGAIEQAVQAVPVAVRRQMTRSSPPRHCLRAPPGQGHRRSSRTLRASIIGPSLDQEACGRVQTAARGGPGPAPTNASPRRQRPASSAPKRPRHPHRHPRTHCAEPRRPRNPLQNYSGLSEITG